MNKIIEYTIVCWRPISWDNSVNKLLKKGYQPYGSPFFADGFFMQAIVKYESEQKQKNK